MPLNCLEPFCFKEQAKKREERERPSHFPYNLSCGTRAEKAWQVLGKSAHCRSVSARRRSTRVSLALARHLLQTSCQAGPAGDADAAYKQLSLTCSLLDRSFCVLSPLAQSLTRALLSHGAESRHLLSRRRRLGVRSAYLDIFVGVKETPK